jgi:hypothetical protein
VVGRTAKPPHLTQQKKFPKPTTHAKQNKNPASPQSQPKQTGQRRLWQVPAQVRQGRRPPRPKAAQNPHGQAVQGQGRLRRRGEDPRQGPQGARLGRRPRAQDQGRGHGEFGFFSERGVFVFSFLRPARRAPPPPPAHLSLTTTTNNNDHNRATTSTTSTRRRSSSPRRPPKGPVRFLERAGRRG